MREKSHAQLDSDYDNRIEGTRGAHATSEPNDSRRREDQAPRNIDPARSWGSLSEPKERITSDI